MRFTFVLIFAIHSLSHCSRLDAASGADWIVRGKSLVDADLAGSYDWPEGTLGLANDPLRVNGWLVWFSGLPNDVVQFDLQVRNTADVQHCIELLRDVKQVRRQIVLHPGSEPRYPGHAPAQRNEERIGAVYQVGSQKIVNQWFERLPESRPGIKRFGNEELIRPMEAHPPTLVLYVSHPAVDLEKLRFPKSIHVATEIDANFRKEQGNQELIEVIERFAAEHNARRASRGSPSR
jgi:hypothetical protein